ncbi:MAG: M14-type cytosolic carboxypeptidase [Granulosicoccus sp.]
MSAQFLPIVINSQFDSGNIRVVDATDPSDIRLEIVEDACSDFLQWFHFSASGLAGNLCAFVIENAGASTYPRGWENYHVVFSLDRQTWERMPAEYDGAQLRWTVQAETDQMWFAYFAPYSMEQHADLVSSAALTPMVRHKVLGLTHQGRPIDYLQVSSLIEHDVDANDASLGNLAERAQLWVIARQHPGESMAEWFVEGWLDRLLDPDDATSVALRRLADIHVVPNMNPDGSFLGHLRTNSLGVNLNREWEKPDVERSPEVFHVLERMKQTGVDLALDVHGDEALPYNFIAGTEGVSGWTTARSQELVNLKYTWASINPDFQDQYGYPINSPGKANLTFCSNQLASRFGCLAMTLEMPFKDTANAPRLSVGWSPERCQRLGASYVDVAYLALTKRLLTKS